MLLRILSATLLATLALAAPASAQSTPFGPCLPYPGDMRICTAQVPSFDQSPLDVDLTLPARGTGNSHPLMIFLHGFGNNKREWESINDEGDGADKHRWNSHWFARHGFYVLTYTARGFKTDFPGDNRPTYQPETPGGTSEAPLRGTIHIKSREFEVRDTQYLAAIAADAFPDLDRDRVAVSGGSYGGGESWLQAADPIWDSFPGLPALKLQVAVPKYPWTDVGYALAPNGHGGGTNGDDIYESSLGRPESEEGQGYPIGTAKASYISGLFARGETRGTFKFGPTPTPNEEDARSPLPVSIPAWNARIAISGDPYSPEAGDEIIRQARRGLTQFRSAYYQDWTGEASERKVAVYSIQGWTDDLFEAVESFRMFKFLKRMDPRWPVEVSVADIGHSRAQNKPATWKRLNEQAWQFLKSNLNGAHEQSTTVSSEPTLCSTANADASMRLTGKTPEGLASGTLSVAFGDRGTLTDASGLGDDDNTSTDPIVGSIVAPTPDQCRRSTRGTQRDSTGYTAISDPLPKNRTYIGLGFVELPNYALAGATATLNARVWDIPPDGTPANTLLMTRGTYRIDTAAGSNDADPAAGTLRLPLYGNHWPLAPGHRLRVDLQEVDAPTFRPTNVPNELSFDAPRLVLPTRQAGELALTGE